jgi:competence protein ComEC
MSLTGAWQWLLLFALLLRLRQRPAWWWLPLPLMLWWVLLLPDGQMPANSEFRVAALDVGQGSAILVDTHLHRLIFDAGPRYTTGFDLGDAVVVPSFRQLGSTKLDVLVISHDDLDHSGGAKAVIEQLAPTRILASYSLPAELGHSDVCSAGTGWQWDGVSFRFLHPELNLTQDSVRRTSDNDTSCVLLISNGRRSVLLAGDISSRIERKLPKQPVDLLMAPHHGSRTSSSKSFVRGFAPALVFVSTDRRSRFGHPHPDVVERYGDARLLVTGRAGALIWRSDVPAVAFAWRDRRSAYWQRRFSGR